MPLFCYRSELQIRYGICNTENDSVEIWREPAFYEGSPRFVEVFEILRQRYGARLREVRPTAASGAYLYGDRLNSPRIIEDLNARLRHSESD